MDISVVYEVYGFASWVGSIIAFIGFLIWLLVPDAMMAKMGVNDYLPNKYWAVAIPNVLAVLLLFLPILYLSYSSCFIPVLNSFSLVTDFTSSDEAVEELSDVTGWDAHRVMNTTSKDVPLSVVNKFLYDFENEE